MVELPSNIIVWAFAAATVFGLLTGSAEWLHSRRIARISGLAFGPARRPALWAQMVPVLRTIAVACLAGALTILMLLVPMSHRRQGDVVTFEKLKHVVLVLDVSPSMRLKDAGPDGNISRLRRAREVMDSYFQRVPMNEFRVSVIAVYTDAFPVVEDTSDIGVVRNILNDLPMHFAFVPGETDLFSGIRQAAELCRGRRPGSTAVILVADGDTVPSTGMPRMPASVADVLVVGVGDPNKGSFINGHNSRQDVSTLRQISARLGGVYHNGNEKHLSTALIDRLTAGMEGESRFQLTIREAALLLAGGSIVILSIIPFALHYLGTGWQPGIRQTAETGKHPDSDGRTTAAETDENAVEHLPAGV
ncbi:MAG TPA: VWA domain-containing protein [Planctomycetes bacterium]|nr:VWA domain-containing protein [Fuerstiella sp.]HIK92199.1 VWA domain-containing protein [Planctomycetota bacterium]